MKCVGEDDQTEQEFMHSMWSRKSECCGALVPLRMKPSSVAEMSAALNVLDATRVLSQADRGDGSSVMCAAHWYDVAMVINGVGEAYENELWKSLKTSLFIIVSRTAGWDHREMFNRFASFYRTKTGGYRSQGAM